MHEKITNTRILQDICTKNTFSPIFFWGGEAIAYLLISPSPTPNRLFEGAYSQAHEGCRHSMIRGVGAQ